VEDANDGVEEMSKAEIELDLSKLNRKEKVQLFHRESPEFKGILADFEEKVAEASDKLQPVLDLINDGILPDGNPAAKYVRSKHQLILNYCANISAFLMFKTRRTSLKFHPITSRLVQYKQLLDQMQPLDQVMAPQIDKVLEIARKNDAKKTSKALRRLVAKHNGVKTEKKRDTVKPESKKRKRLQILSTDGGTEEDSSRRKHEEPESLTFDEQKAVEMYEALKSKKAKLDSDNEEEEEEEVDEQVDEDVKDKDDIEEEGDERRGITYQIAKNKGLQPKRSKLQRNPRVKHRHKYEKAKVRRKGQVREVRKEVKKYSGEMTGINARVKKGVKIM